jgi:hypothetical protein
VQYAAVRGTPPSTDGRHDRPQVSDGAPDDGLFTYLAEIMDDFGPARRPEPATRNGALDERVFGLLAHRRFSYLGRTKAERYRPLVMPSIRRDLADDRPVRFFFDIGPGYHASPEPERRASASTWGWPSSSCCARS